MTKFTKCAMPKFSFTCALIALFLPSLLYASDRPEHEGLHIYPYLQNVTTDGITVLWETTQPSMGIVEFGEEAEMPLSVSETTPSRLHQLRLSGLKADTTYHYQVRYNNETLPPAHFRTLPTADTDSWRVVFYGDNRSNPRVHTKIVHEIRKAKPRLVINTGDLVENGNNHEEWKRMYFDPLRGLSEFVSVFTCLGNHEKNAPLYYDYMDLPDEQGEVYYAIPFANAVFIALNSNAGDARYGPDSPQTQWLIKTLEKHRDKKWVIVFFHHPLFRSHPTRGITAQRWSWQPIFDQHEVDLVITGHDHHYMRTRPIGTYTGKEKTGVRHIISGGGGAGLYPFQPRVYVAQQEKTHHMIVLEASDDRLRGRIVNLEGKTIDVFVIEDKKPTPSDQFVSYEIFIVEEALRRAIADAPFLIPDEDGVQASFSLEVDNPFTVPLYLRFDWPMESGWSFSPMEESIRVVPGTPIRIPIEGGVPKDALYPVPHLQMHWTDLHGETVFVNHTTTLYPLKVRPKTKLVVPRGQRAPRLDGKLRDRAWRKTKAWTSFVDVQNDAHALYDVQMRAIHHRGVLYIAAEVKGELPDPRTRPLRRDALSLSKSEHVRVHVGSGEDAFTFIVNIDGSQLDAMGRDRKWNHPGFRSATSRTQRGWKAEMAIPLAALSLSMKDLRLNVAYRNEIDQTDSELFPSFGLARRESRVPAFTGEWSDPSHFAPARLRQ